MANRLKRHPYLLAFISVVFIVTAFIGSTVIAGLRDRSSLIELYGDHDLPGNYINMPAITAPSGNPDTNYGWIYYDGTHFYFENSSGTQTDLLTAVSTATDFALNTDADAGDYDITSLDKLEFYDSGLYIDGGADGVLSLSSDGTFAIDTADWDISTTGTITNASMSADQISAAALTLGNNYLSIGTDPADAGTIRLPNAGSILFEAAPAGTDISALSVDASEVVQIGASGASGVTITPDVTCSGDISAVDGSFSGNVSVVGTFQQDAITAATAATTLTIDGTGAGGVTIGGTSTGTITLGGGATLVDLPSTVDMTLSGGDLAVTDTANADMVTFTNNTLTAADLLTLSASGTRTSNNVIAITDGATQASTISITANSQTSGYGLSYANSGAGLTGAAINLSVTDGAGFTGDYLRCYDGAAEDFTIERYGEATIAGLAGADMLTITAGDLQMTDGFIDVDDGYISVNSDENHASNFTRNYNGAGSSAVLTVTDDHTSSTQSSLFVDQDGTGNSTCLKLTHDGDYPVIDIDAGAARTGNVIDINMANQLAEKAIAISGAMTGTAGEGVIEVHSTGVITAQASLLRLDFDTAQMQAGDGALLDIDDDSTAAAGTQYGVLINSANNEALYVATGLSKFAELVTFASGIDVDEDIDIDFDASDEEISIDSTATGYVAGAGIVTVHGNHAGNVNDAPLLRLVYQTNGDAQDTFILCEDNSTGVAGNGDDQFKVGTNGDVTTSGDITFGGYMVNTPLQENVTTEADLTDPLTSSIMIINGDNDADSDTVDLQNGAVDGQWITLVAGTGVDADDVITINFGDTTCTNCAATAFNKQGENGTFFWDDTNSTWVQTSLNTNL